MLAALLGTACSTVLGFDDLTQRPPLADGGADGGPGVPAHAPSAVLFRDEDPVQGKLAGTVTIKRAADETDVTAYALYWGAGPTTKQTLVASLPKTGADVTKTLAGDVPAGATHLIAVAVNAAGEMPTGVAVSPIDNFARYARLAVGRPPMNGLTPAAAIDTTNPASPKLVVVTDDESNDDKPGLFRCEIDGSKCVYTDISAGQGHGSGLTPSLVVDSKNAKLLAVTNNQANGQRLALFRCDLGDTTGASCTYTDISAGQGSSSAVDPQAMIDAKNGRLLVVTNDKAGASDNPALFSCNLDGSNATYADISAGQGVGSGENPTAALDVAGGKVLVVTEDQSQSKSSTLFRCNLDGTGCTHTDISAGWFKGSGVDPSLVLDVPGGKLLAVTTDNVSSDLPALFRCGLDGSSCAHLDISAGAPAESGIAPSAVVDAVHGKLLVATTDYSNNSLGSVALFRCELDGTGCKHVDMSAGQGKGSGLALVSLIDTTNDRLLVVADDDTNGDHQLGLYTLDLW